MRNPPEFTPPTRQVPSSSDDAARYTFWPRHPASADAK